MSCQYNTFFDSLHPAISSPLPHIRFDKNELNDEFSMSFPFLNSDSQSHPDESLFSYNDSQNFLRNLKTNLNEVNLKSSKNKEKIFLCEKVKLRKLNLFSPRDSENFMNSFTNEISNDIRVEGVRQSKKKQENIIQMISEKK